MTNAEKFLKDENLIDTFIGKFNDFACDLDWDLEYHNLESLLRDFFKQQV